jgi:hypothetical protein
MSLPRVVDGILFEAIMKVGGGLGRKRGRPIVGEYDVEAS